MKSQEAETGTGLWSPSPIPLLQAWSAGAGWAGLCVSPPLDTQVLDVISRTETFSLPGQLVPPTPTLKKVSCVFSFKLNSLYFSLCPLPLVPSRHRWEEPGSIFITPSHQAAADIRALLPRQLQRSRRCSRPLSSSWPSATVWLHVLSRGGPNQTQ